MSKLTTNEDDATKTQTTTLLEDVKKANTLISGLSGPCDEWVAAWDRDKANHSPDAQTWGDEYLTQRIAEAATKLLRELLEGNKDDFDTWLSRFDEQFPAGITDPRFKTGVNAARDKLVVEHRKTSKAYEKTHMDELLKTLPGDWRDRLEELWGKVKWESSVEMERQTQVQRKLKERMDASVASIQKTLLPKDWESAFIKAQEGYTDDDKAAALESLKAAKLARDQTALQALVQKISQNADSSTWATALDNYKDFDADLTAGYKEKLDQGHKIVQGAAARHTTLLTAIEAFQPAAEVCSQTSEVGTWRIKQDAVVLQWTQERDSCREDASRRLSEWGLSSLPALDKAVPSIESKQAEARKAIAKGVADAQDKVTQWEEQLSRAIQQKLTVDWGTQISPPNDFWQRKAGKLQVIYNQFSPKVVVWQDETKRSLEETTTDATVTQKGIQSRAEALRKEIHASFQSLIPTRPGVVCEQALMSSLNVAESALFAEVKAQGDQRLQSESVQREENRRQREVERKALEQVLQQERRRAEELRRESQNAASRSEKKRQLERDIQKTKAINDRAERNIAKMDKGERPDEAPESTCACLGSLAVLVTTLLTVLLLRYTLSPAAEQLDRVQFYTVSHEPWKGKDVDAAYQSANRDRRVEMQAKLWNATLCNAEGSASPACSCAYGILSGIPLSNATSSSYTLRGPTFARASAWAGASLSIPPPDALAACNRVHHHHATVKLEPQLVLSRMGLVIFLVLLLCLERLLSIVPTSSSPEAKEQKKRNKAEVVAGVINRVLQGPNKTQSVSPEEVDIELNEASKDNSWWQRNTPKRIPYWVHGAGGLLVSAGAALLAPNYVGWLMCVVVTVTSMVVLLVCAQFRWKSVHPFYFCATLQVLAWIGLAENGTTDMHVFWSVTARAVATSLLYVSSRSDRTWLSRGLMCVMWLNDFWAPYMDDASRSEVQPLPYLPTILLLVTLWVPRESSSRVLMHELLVAIVLVYFLREHTTISRADRDALVTDTMQLDASDEAFWLRPWTGCTSTETPPPPRQYVF